MVAAAVADEQAKEFRQQFAKSANFLKEMERLQAEDGPDRCAGDALGAGYGEEDTGEAGGALFPPPAPPRREEAPADQDAGRAEPAPGAEGEAGPAQGGGAEEAAHPAAGQAGRGRGGDRQGRGAVRGPEGG